MRDLAGKVAVVTGGGSGIGRALCAALARAGTTVAVCDIDVRSAEATADLLIGEGAKATAHQVDVASEADMRSLVDDVLAAHTHVDVLVNNAGVATAPGATVDVPLNTFRQVIKVNLWGVIHGSLLFLPHLLERPRANLVNVSSYTGLLAMPHMSSYSTSKFGVRGFTESLQMEFAGSPLAVTLVYPGATRTNLMQTSSTIDPDRKEALQRALDDSRSTTPERVAAAILGGIRKDRVRVLAGTDTKVLDRIVRHSPNRHARLMHRNLKNVLRKTLGHS